MKKFKSARFGELAYEEQDVIFLPDGLVGMPALQNWLMLDMDEGIPLKWFHSLDRPDFCLPISEPFYFSDDYQVKIPPEVQTRLGVESAADVAVLIITTIHPGGTKVTGNLLAPVLVGAETRRGVQLPQADESFSVNQEINYLKFGLAVASESADNDSSDTSPVRGGPEEIANGDRQKVSI